MRPPPGPFLPVQGTFGWSGLRPDVSPQQAAESLPSSKVTTMRGAAPSLTVVGFCGASALSRVRAFASSAVR